ncbi:MAG: TonB-dependent receptor [Flavobacteriaceae bacterium]|nr:TonB-dependent receptor [Flavobacteriaceae bacterium]
MRSYLSYLFILFSVAVFAQKIKIVSNTTNAPIFGVAVYNDDKSKTGISDLDGMVLLDGFSNHDNITFKHISFQLITLKKGEIPSVLRLVPNAQDLKEIVISASKFEQSKQEVPQKIVSIKSEDILFQNPQTSADLLQNSGQVFVQKSQLGGGSPMIRGFSTNRLLISVDGVRMNNAIFRGGNLQNVISIDPFSVQNTEVILGAGSVIYGSDAIGGVMNFYTQKPRLSNTDSLEVKTNVLGRYATANTEKTAHVDVNLGLSDWAFYTSLTYSDFEDLKMGKYGPDDYLRPEFVITQDGVDQVVQNDDPRLQRFTAYNQVNLLQKIHYKSDHSLSFDLGVHYSTTSDYPRYDRLIRYTDDGALRSAEWSYGPQRWFLGNFQLTKLSSRSNFYNKIKFTMAYQNFQESRIDRNFGSVTRRIRAERVDVISANLDLEKRISEKSKVFYGAEYIYNKVGSEGKEVDISDGTSQKTASRYPNGASWQSIAAYLSYKYKPNNKFTVQTGARYNHIVIKADLSENNTFYNFPYNDANLNTGALTGTAGLSWVVNKIMQWKLNATTAFRAPNIDDVGKVFDSEPGSVVVPNADLKPEYAYGGELALDLNFESIVKLDIATYYTYLHNALVRRDFTIDGESQILYDGEISNVQAIQNASKAWIYGFELGAEVNVSKHVQFRTQYSVVGGTEEDDSGAEVPVRHVAPAFGNAHLIWKRKQWKFDAYVNFNGELSNANLSPSVSEYLFAKDENGAPYSPSWHTLNLRSQYKISNSTTLTATLENITNQRYRTYSSGLTAPGMNLIVALKYNL